jgi:tetratricopeptide (TPR) repeat protein
MWLTRGDRPKAEEAFAKALASGFNDPQTRRLIAYAWIRHGHAAQALEAYDACVKVDLSGRYENRKNLYARAAEDLVAHGQAPRAVEYMEESFRLDSRDEHNFLGFARAALKAGRRDLAAQWLSRAVKVAGDDVDTWMEISDMFLAVNPPRPQLP